MKSRYPTRTCFLFLRFLTLRKDYNKRKLQPSKKNFKKYSLHYKFNLNIFQTYCEILHGYNISIRESFKSMRINVKRLIKKSLIIFWSYISRFLPDKQQSVNIFQNPYGWAFPYMFDQINHNRFEYQKQIYLYQDY